jgi:hypothetical protein
MVQWKWFGTGTLALLPCLLLFSGHAFGEIYKWTDALGNVHFSDKRPNKQPVKAVSSPSNSLSVVGHGTTGGSNNIAQPSYTARQPKVIIYSTE